MTPYLEHSVVALPVKRRSLHVDLDRHERGALPVDELIAAKLDRAFSRTAIDADTRSAQIRKGLHLIGTKDRWLHLRV